MNNPTQYQLYQRAQQRLAERNQHFLEMISCPVTPLTNQDLVRLIEAAPERWKQFEGFVGKLKDAP